MDGVKSEAGSVLVVEDEPGVRACVARALTKEGYRVAAATTGEEALRILEASPFDVILTDLRLPGLQGKRLVMALARASRGSAVIVMSADASESEPIEGILEEAADYLVKPVRRETLLRAVAKAIRERGARSTTPGARPSPGLSPRGGFLPSRRPI